MISEDRFLELVESENKVKEWCWLQVVQKLLLEWSGESIVFYSRIMAIIHSDYSTTRLRLVLQFSSSWIIVIIIRSLKNVGTIY
jgi:hypothetical protein